MCVVTGTAEVNRTSYGCRAVFVCDDDDSDDDDDDSDDDGEPFFRCVGTGMT